MMADLEYRQELKNKYNELVYQIAQKNINGEDYNELLEKARSINEQLLVLDIQYRYESILADKIKNNMLTHIVFLFIS